MADTLAHLRTLPQCNGRAAAMGFCYGGPYAILGPKRLGYDAGLSCHGTQLLDFIWRSSTASRRRSASCGATRTTRRRPRCSTPIAPVPSRMTNVEVHIFPGILHGYMMPGSPKAFDAQHARVLDVARACDPRRLARRESEADRSGRVRRHSPARPSARISASQRSRCSGLDVPIMP